MEDTTTNTAPVDFSAYIRPSAPAAPRRTRPTSAAELLARDGLDFTVSKRQLRMDGYDVSTPTKDGAPRMVAIASDADSRVLGFTSPGFGIVQHRQAFAPFDAIIREGEGFYNRAVSYDHGATVAVEIGVRRGKAEVVKGDWIQMGVRVSNSHDGSGSYRGETFVRRLVCTNGLTRGARSRLFTLRHSGNVEMRLDRVHALVNRALAQFEAATAQFRSLAARRVQTDEIVAYLGRVVPNPTDPEARKARANAERERDEIMALISSGAGANIPGVRGSAWGVYNAVTEYVDHKRAVRGTGDRYVSTQIEGPGVAIKNAALDAALELWAPQTLALLSSNSAR